MSFFFLPTKQIEIKVILKSQQTPLLFNAYEKLRSIT